MHAGEDILHYSDLIELHQAGKAPRWFTCERGAWFLVDRL